MRTRGVLFDLYGTLVVYGEMEKAWNAWYDVIYEALRINGLELSQTEFRPCCGGFFEKPEPQDNGEALSVVERRLHRLAAEVNVAIPREQALQAIEDSIDVWHDYVRLDPEAMEVLREIGRNRSIALVSNFDYAPYVHRLMARWDLEPLFDTILVSDAVGVKKPHPEIFEQALRELELTASQTIHVGDSREDIEGAVGAGIRPVWIDRQCKDRWRAQPESDVTRISSLTELLDLLD
ncbi:MAG TPA: HAD family hydrolase [Negativicutes bacterium]|nr:HAD family hydrolase [Negativicutes bacterium]